MGRNDEKWMANYEALKAYIKEHHHLPPKNAPLGAKYRMEKKNKAGTLTEEQIKMLQTLADCRSTEHTRGRRKKNI